MKPEISEFSYGFALTNELVGWISLSAAPIFPSLIEEGKAGGGYDVKFDEPGFPLFLQFKRSHCMVRRKAREYGLVAKSGGSLSLPYYRFPITEVTTSDQHELLLALDDGSNLVFYAAPRFHKRTEINDAWNLSEVVGRSAFFSPSDIGHLDTEQHYVAFDHKDAWLCSEPRRLSPLSSRDLENKLKMFLEKDSRTLEERLPSLVEGLLRARSRGTESAEAIRREARLIRKLRDEDYVEAISAPTSSAEDQDLGDADAPASRAPKKLDEKFIPLRQASDIAAQSFDAQMIIVQKKA